MKGKEFNAEDAAEILLPDPCDKSYGIPSWLHSCRGDSQAPPVPAASAPVAKDDDKDTGYKPQERKDDDKEAESKTVKEEYKDDKPK